MDTAQAGRDAAAVINDVGEEPAYVTAVGRDSGDAFYALGHGGGRESY